MKRHHSDNADLELHVVDLPTVPATELDELWQRDAQWWREMLRWDISEGLEALRHVVARGSVPGKVIKVGTQTIGYAYYVIIGRLGLIPGLSVAPQWSTLHVGGMLLHETLVALRQHGVSRIESQCLAVDCPWLPAAFAQEGVQTFWRQLLRLELAQRPQPVATPPVDLVPWRSASLSAAASIMHAAYSREVDAIMTTRYRTLEGCCIVLNQLLNQGGCGQVVTDASGLLYDKGQPVGFVIITETLPGQAHLAQITVLPSYQGRGVGRALLNASVAQLAAQGFDTLSLIVSQENQRALRMYQNSGFSTVWTYPTFTWEPAAQPVR